MVGSDLKFHVVQLSHFINKKTEAQKRLSFEPELTQLGRVMVVSNS